MLSLQNRIALILVVSMMAAMAIGTFATVLVVSGAAPDASIEQAGDVLAMLGSLDTLPSEPPAGRIVPDATRLLETKLARLGAAGKALVVDNQETGNRVAAYLLPDGRWATIEVPRFPAPPSAAWLVLTTWLTVTLIGVGSVALLMARRVTEPFAIIEKVVAAVGPGGELPQLPETGSAEARRVRVALNSLSARVKAAVQTKMRIVAAAGHDLRTPMTRLRLRAELLPDREQEDWFSDIDELDQIAESAIGLVREESGSADQTTIDLSRLVAETVSELAATDLPVQLVRADPAWVRAGPLSLRRALRNLMMNAAIYGGVAMVWVHIRDENVQVRIEDDGPGIPEHLLSRVFEPFFRGDPSRSATKGAGLGLTIANEIIERLGGSLTIENRPGGGLLQIVTLPATPPASPL